MSFLMFIIIHIRLKITGQISHFHLSACQNILVHIIRSVAGFYHSENLDERTGDNRRGGERKRGRGDGEKGEREKTSFSNDRLRSSITKMADLISSTTENCLITQL